MHLESPSLQSKSQTSPKGGLSRSSSPVTELTARSPVKQDKSELSTDPKLKSGMSPEQNKTKPDSSLYPLVDSKSLLVQSRLEPSELKERLGLIEEDVASSCVLRDKFSPTQDRPESSTVLKDTPRVLLKERSGAGSPPGTRDQKILLPNSSQDELMEVEKSEQPLSQVLPTLSPEHKEMSASNFESSPEIEESPAVLSTLDQSQSQPSKAAEIPAVASCWVGPQVSPEHKELSHSPPGTIALSH